jgi:hypothetical protein
MKITTGIPLVALITMLLTFCILNIACEGAPPSADTEMRKKQEVLEQQVASQLGLPNIQNFRMKRTFKEIKELCDQEKLATYAYTFSEVSGKKQFFCNSVGYGIPFATQYTNPQKLVFHGHNYEASPMAQADPDGLFYPASAEGTWIMCKDPKSDKVAPIYVEPRVIVSPFKLPTDSDPLQVEATK